MRKGSASEPLPPKFSVVTTILGPIDSVTEISTGLLLALGSEIRIIEVYVPPDNPEILMLTVISSSDWPEVLLRLIQEVSGYSCAVQFKVPPAELVTRIFLLEGDVPPAIARKSKVFTLVAIFGSIPITVKVTGTSTGELVAFGSVRRMCVVYSPAARPLILT